MAQPVPTKAKAAAMCTEKCLEYHISLATFFLLHVFVWLLFEGGVYFFGNPTHTNNGRMRYVRVIR